MLNKQHQCKKAWYRVWLSQKMSNKSLVRALFWEAPPHVEYCGGEKSIEEMLEKATNRFV